MGSAMQFTGRNLELVRAGLVNSLQEVNNMLVTCPDPDDPDNAKALAYYRDERAELETLLARVNAALNKENR